MNTFLKFDSDTVAFAPQIFNDVPIIHWAYKFIQEAEKQLIIKGYLDNTFHPNQPISRIETLKIIFEAADIKPEDVNTILEPHFNDIDSTHWGYSYLKSAYSLGIVQGYIDGSFRPNQNVTRAEIAKITIMALVHNLIQ